MTANNKTEPMIRWFSELRNEDVPEVGGKNASLGEMLRELSEQGVRVPDGFATTADAYRSFLRENQLEKHIRRQLDRLENGDCTVQEAGRNIRSEIRQGELHEAFREQLLQAYSEPSNRYEQEEVDVAVRSSATAEDLPTASFAGQQETYLNVRGGEALLDACRNCFASLFTDRAITYRTEKGFDHMEVALSVGVQKMVRSDEAGAGVMFTLDMDSGFPDVAVINAAWGLGETVVQGTVSPDEYTVFKPFLQRNELTPILRKKCGGKEVKMIYGDQAEGETKVMSTTQDERDQLVLREDEILTLARWAVTIEDHYERPMDIEWAKDGKTGDLFVVQARPETVQSQKQAGEFHTYRLKETSEQLLSGLSIGESITSGPVSVIHDVEDIESFQEGSVLVTEMTQPDWVPIMKQARAIVTDEGGRTCHAAIVSRELGVPAVVGTGNGTEVLKDGQTVTVSCAEGQTGHVYSGELAYEDTTIDIEDLPETRTDMMINVASPEAALNWWRLPTDGIGLARMEFIINNTIKIHPMALVRYDELDDREAKEQIDQLTVGYEDRSQFFVDRLSEGIAQIAASQHPERAIVRMSDFKSNEYAKLIGGEQFEPVEDNPMLGVRGASRYERDLYRDGFALECRAIKHVREQMGFENVDLMIPFCRTLEEADRVLSVMEENGLKRGDNDLNILVMAEIPSNVLLADGFAERFDGFSIGSNDLTQLVLGIDRDSTELADLFDERNEAVKQMIRMLIETAHHADRSVGICGQAPSDYPEFAEFLVREDIDSMSLTPDRFVPTKKRIAELESS